MTVAQMQHMPVKLAYVCFNEDAEGRVCGTVGNCAERCPACGNEHLLSLSQVLNRGEADAG